MSKLHTIDINSDNAYKIIKDCIYSCATTPIKLDDIKFHHNLQIKTIPSVLKYGLLSNKYKAKIIEKRELTEIELYLYSDEHHVNGINYISLSSTMEDLSLMYRDEQLYDTYNTSISGIVISNEVKAMKTSINYYNEYLVENIIPVELFNSLEIRLLRLFENKFNNLSKEEKTKKIIEAYESLREIALTLKENNLDIPLRESSNVLCNEQINNALTLDPEKIIKIPKLILK